MTDETKTALLSKLRAPVADERAAFETRFNVPPENWTKSGGGGYRNIWIETRWEGWRARAALASAPVAGEAVPSDAEIMAIVREQCPDFDAAHEGPDQDDMIRIARALLSRYAAPQASEAVRDAVHRMRNDLMGIEEDVKHSGYAAFDHTCLKTLQRVIEGLAALSAQPAAEPLSNPKQFPLTGAENIRAGAPYDDPAFEALCREHGIWGTAEAALCAVFWRHACKQRADATDWSAIAAEAQVERDAARAERDALIVESQQRAAGTDERTAFEAMYQADYDDPGAACEREHFGKGYRAGILATRHRDDSQQASEPEPKRFVILKESGSRFAYVNDTELGRTVKRFDVLKGDGWGKAERLATRLNAQHDGAGLAAQSAKEQNDAN